MKKLSFVVMFLLLCMVGSSYATDYHYATTDMTWAEFYAGELGEALADLAVSYDAVTTATQRFLTRFEGFTSATSGDGSVFYGVKAVNVRMSSDVYALLSKDSRYSFDTTAFTEYKDVASDGSFGKMVTATIGANATLTDLSVSIAGGKSNGHGNYRLNISGFNYASLDVSVGTSYDKVLGATLETNDGKVYGMKPLHNLWVRGNLAEQIGFSVEDFTESNGTHLSYAHTADLPGKTINKITIMLRDQPDPVISCNVYVKQWTDATITATVVSPEIAAGNDVKVTITSSDLPAAYKPYLLKTGNRIDRGTETAFTYENGVITISSADVASGQYIIAFESDNYVDITATFTVNIAHYATTDMIWAEFYAGEVGSTAATLSDDGYDAVSTATKNFINRMVQLTATSDDSGTTYTGVKAVQVRMTDDVYKVLSNDRRYTFRPGAFSEYKEVSTDGSFGKMVTDSIDASASFDVRVSAYNSYHTQYMLSITGPSLASLDLKIASGEGRSSTFNYYLGGTLTTSGDNKVYGLKHLSNLWVSTGELGFAVSDYLTERTNHQSYKHTADLAGKTIKQIRFMIKNQPDLVINCNVPVKYLTTASATKTEPAGGYLESMGNVSIPITLTGTSSDASYTLSEVATVVGRATTPLATSTYSYSNGVLTLNGPIAAGSYSATFTSEKYSDIVVSFTLYSTNATSKIISPDTKNAGGVSFLVTPKGAVSSVDKFIDGSKYVTADAYTSPDKNFSAVYSPTGALAGSGFSFDVTLNGVPSGKIAVVGVGKQFYVNPTTASSDYQTFRSKVQALEIIDTASGYRGAEGAALKNLGLTVVSVRGNDSVDVTGFTTAGLRISDDDNIEVFYGVMLADAAASDLGGDEGKTLAFSDEGEILAADGANDGHLKAAWYLVLSGTTPSTDPGTNPGTDPGTNPGSNTGTSTTYTPSIISAPALDPVADRSTILSALTEALKSENPSLSIPENVEIVDLSDTETLNVYRTPGTASVTVNSNMLDDDKDESVSFIVGSLTFTEPIAILLGAELSDDATPGWDLNWKLITTVGAPEVVDAAENGSTAVFLEKKADGTTEPTTTVPDNRSLTVSAYFSEAGTYSPIITTSKPEEDNKNDPGSSGGCNAMGSLVPVMMLAALLVLRRR